MGMLSAEKRPVLVCGESRTKQEFKDQCDMKKIMARYRRTGALPITQRLAPRFADVSQVPDLHTAMNLIESAERAFGHLPATIRKKFDNDMLVMVDWLGDPENEKEAIELGLKPKPPKAEVPESPPEQPPAPPAAPDGGGEPSA